MRPLTLGPATFDPITGRLLSRLFDLGSTGRGWSSGGRRPTTTAARRAARTSWPPEDTGGRGCAGAVVGDRWRHAGWTGWSTGCVEPATTTMISCSSGSGRAANGGPQFVDVSYRWRLDEIRRPAGRRRHTLGQLGLHLAAGRRPARPAARPGARTLVRHRARRVLPGHPTGRPGRPVLRRHRRAERPLLTAAGDRPPRGAAQAGDRRRIGGPAAARARWPNAGGHRPGFTLTRHTPQQLDRARHPYELAGASRAYLFIDDAVHGVGSRACGIDVLPSTRSGRARAIRALVFQPTRRVSRRRRSGVRGRRPGPSPTPGSCGRTGRPRAGRSGSAGRPTSSTPARRRHLGDGQEGLTGRSTAERSDAPALRLTQSLSTRFLYRQRRLLAASCGTGVRVVANDAAGTADAPLVCDTPAR